MRALRNALVLLLLVCLPVEIVSEEEEGGHEAVLEVREGVEMVWEKPREKPVALLLLFHRAGRSARSWWPSSARCRDCEGLPEESRIAASAVALNFATVALSCVESRSRRWSQKDGPLVAQGLLSLMKDQQWGDLPLFVIGVGCGAGFVATALPSSLSVEIRGVHIQLMSDAAGLRPSVIAKAFKNGQGIVGAGWFGRAQKALDKPPAKVVVVSYSQKDDIVKKAAKAIKNAWEDNGATVLEQVIHPLPLSRSYFSDAFASLSSSDGRGKKGSEKEVKRTTVPMVESRHMVDALKEKGFLDKRNFLLDDPTSTDWRAVVSAPVGERGALELGTLRSLSREAHQNNLRSPIGEAVNRAFALSEVDSRAIHATLHLFLDTLKKTNNGEASSFSSHRRRRLLRSSFTSSSSSRRLE